MYFSIQTQRFRQKSKDRWLARAGVAAYAFTAVKQPFINVEEKIDRFVGRRTGTPDALSTANSNKADSIAWRKALGGIRVPRGVHRFRTHEEADQWLWRMIARPAN
jgi:hypothetical protein